VLQPIKRTVDYDKDLHYAAQTFADKKEDWAPAKKWINTIVTGNAINGGVSRDDSFLAMDTLIADGSYSQGNNLDKNKAALAKAHYDASRAALASGGDMLDFANVGLTARKRGLDEKYVQAIHAEELNVPRLGGTRAAGTVKAKSNAEITIEAGTKLTDGKGHFWSVISTTVVQPNITTEISVTADQISASWNFTGTSLMWVSPIAGLSGTAEVISIAGGSDEEELEVWRARMLESKQLGQARDRESDLERAMKSVPGIGKIYIYKKRRGLGSMDVSITAVGNPPTLPAQALLDSAQIVLDEEAGFWADCRVYSPTQQLIDITAAVKGMGVNFTDVETTIRSYIAELAPVEEYQANVLVSRIMALANVEDVVLTPNSNVQPIVNWMHTYWLRAGTVSVSAAP
jgi:uncharacterized phage protein gp47/JayE